jgi:hypothetical protein
MTEQEALKTICPNYKAAVLSNPDRNYFPADLNKMDDIKCDASACMMWRWNRKLSETESTERFTQGYCVFGGKP